MEEHKRIQAAAALAAIVALVLLVIQFAGRPAPKKSSGPGWFSRVSLFGSAPSAAPAPAAAPAAPELAPPERMMTNAVTRLFSSPASAGSSGGPAGAQRASAPPDASNAFASAPRLSGGGSMDFPSGGGGPSPTARGGGNSSSPYGSVARDSASVGRGGPPKVVAAAASPSAGGKPPGGKADTASHGAAAPNSAAGAGAASGADPGNAGLNPTGADGAAPGGGLNDLSAVRASGLSGGAGGSGDPGGGGGGGGLGGGAGGMGGKVPQGKPKESAGKPAGADTSAESSAAAGASAAAGVPINGNPDAEVQTPNAAIGAPQVGTVTVNGGMFKSEPAGPADVPTTVYVTAKTRLVGFTAKMAIDADQPKTSLTYKNGDGLNPRALPFIVVPTDFHLTHPNVKLGDYAAVSYGQKTVYAIVGDKGPAGVLGEGSMALAAGLGIDLDPNSGGVTRKEVRYLIAPGTLDAADPPRGAAAIQTRGKAIFEAAGAPVR